MSDVIFEYQTPSDRESNQKAKSYLELSPWVVQNIVYELIVNHCCTNNPSVDGYTFSQRYNPDETASEIHIGIAYNWKGNPISARPAIFIFREDAAYTNPVIGQMVGINVAESEREKITFCQMNVGVAIIATKLGFIEDLADFIRKPLLQFQTEIQRDFCFMKFRLQSVSKPQIYLESTEHFIVVLNIMTAFSDEWKIKGDDLKIKTISKTLFDNITNKPFTRQ